jgi:hypothetical protein
VSLPFGRSYGPRSTITFGMLLYFGKHVVYPRSTITVELLAGYREARSVSQIYDTLGMLLLYPSHLLECALQCPAGVKVWASPASY